jgi:hypothetical protein
MLVIAITTTMMFLSLVSPSSILSLQQHQAEVFGSEKDCSRLAIIGATNSRVRP